MHAKCDIMSLVAKSDIATLPFVKPGLAFGWEAVRYTYVMLE